MAYGEPLLGNLFINNIIIFHVFNLLSNIL